MKRSIAFSLAIVLSLLGGLLFISVQNVFATTEPPQELTPVGPSQSQETQPIVEGAVHTLYFYANDCPHCIEVIEEVLLPLKEKHGDLLDLRLLEISIPEYYEAMLKIEAYFDVPSEERSIPTLIIDSEILIGETPIRESFGQMVADGIEQGGIAFPKIENVDMGTLVSVDPDTALETDPLCAEDEVCSVEAPIYAAYFYQTGCKECSRVEADLTYLRSQYPQLQVVDFNIYEHADLAAWMTEQIGFEEEFVTPALIIGEQVVLNDQLSLENITEVIEDYRQTGTDPIWTDYDPDQGQQTVLERFRNMGWFAVVAAGLIDGINPCAFATLIFFVSYLTLSRRTGKEVLFVGGAFTMGVFIAYLAVGLGLYQILELVSGTLDVIAKVVYVLTGVFCLVLAVLSFLDYQKARQGEVSDMLLKLPAPLRKRINATIRKGRSSTNYIIGAFVAGILISFLELACTGQVYLPTIIFVSSIPELRLRAILYLIIYNLLFILPLVVIFILVYFGTTSKDLTQFLQKNASWVKLGMSIVFVALGVWLFVSMLF
jgi:cytochrome c biogenesis protein CcdA/glutaredoxin